MLNKMMWLIVFGLLAVLTAACGRDQPSTLAGPGQVSYSFGATVDGETLPPLVGVEAESCSNGYGGLELKFNGVADRIEEAIDDELLVELGVRIFDASRLSLNEAVDASADGNFILSGMVMGVHSGDAARSLMLSSGTMTLSEFSRFEMGGAARFTFTDPDGVNSVVDDSATLEIAFANLAIRHYCTDPWVFFVRPGDGESLSSPTYVQGVMENVAEGDHLHIAVDTGCVPAGEVIPEDRRHVHFAPEQVEILEFELEPGDHSLCLQAGDSAHRALDLTHEITVTVE